MRNTFGKFIGTGAAAVTFVVVAAGCGGDDPSVADTVDAAAATAAAQVDVGTAPSGDAASDTDGATGAETGRPETLLAYRLTAPAGTVVDLDQTLENDAGIIEQGGGHTFEDGPEGLAYSPFITGAEIEFTVEEGGPVDIEIFTTPYDADASPFVDFATIEVVDVLATGQATIDGPTTLRGALPQN